MSKRKAPKKVTPIRKDQLGNFIPTISNTKAPVTINLHQHFYSEQSPVQPTPPEKKVEAGKIFESLLSFGKALFGLIGGS